MPATLSEKRDFLFGAGFVYSFDRDLFLHRGRKVAVSIEYVEDHDLTTIRREAVEEVENPPHGDGSGWRFIFNSKPSASVERQLNELLA